MHQIYSQTIEKTLASDCNMDTEKNTTLVQNGPTSQSFLFVSFGLNEFDQMIFFEKLLNKDFDEIDSTDKRIK